MTNLERGELLKLRRDTRSKTQKCYNPTCNNNAIRSHIQQAEGIIRGMSSVNGKIVQLEELNPWFHEHPYQFQEKGIRNGDVLTFWGFCNSCDTAIFKEIEQDNIDHSLYRNQVLYSYRGFLSEHYKQEYNVKWYEQIFESKKLSPQTKDSFRSLFTQFKLGVMTGRITKLLLEQDLMKGTQNFEFLSFKLPKIEICTSSSFSYPVEVNLDDNLLKAIDRDETIPLINTPIFVNIMPTKSELNVIIGCHSDKKLYGRIDLEKIDRLSEKEKIKLVSDILIKHLETWFVSVSLHNYWRQRKMDKEILRQIEKHLPAEMKNRHIKFNMFHHI